MNLLQTLLNFSERAARIARVIRHDPRLFALLVEEKGELEKNKRFMQDFKTLADVLIQESLRYYVAAKFPMLADHVRGEESSSFTNTLGEKIEVCVCGRQEDTATLLAKVLDGNVEAAKVLAEAVHGEVEEVAVAARARYAWPQLSPDKVGIWIDPIDSTGEYIHGSPGVVDPASLVCQRGLPCVTVLVGVFDRGTGMPLAGVVNQPFAHRDDGGGGAARWRSGIYWGINYQEVLLHSVATLPAGEGGQAPPVIVVSQSEDPKLQESLRKEFGVIHATGAGYKGLVVALGLVQAYFCSKGSTFRWDTCAPHGILRAFGGGIISYKSLLHLGRSKLLSTPTELEKHQLLYHEGNAPLPSSSAADTWCNKDGLVVYKNPQVLTRVYNSISGGRL